MKQTEQKQENVIQAGNLNKKYGDFQLSIPRLEIQGLCHGIDRGKRGG